MATSSALDTLIELATSATDEAAKRLGLAMRATEEAETRLALLQQYRDDYTTRFQQSLMNGLSAQAYHNYRHFLEKLDQAMDGQQQVIASAQARMQRERGSWQESERQRMSYGTLAERAARTARHQQGQREQKAMDEHAARQRPNRG